jgi:hypothetical protein
LPGEREVGFRDLLLKILAAEVRLHQALHGTVSPRRLPVTPVGNATEYSTPRVKRRTPTAH